MKKGNTVYEDREEKRQAQREKHTLACPHCGKPVLDHMTQCPHCKGELKPAGYQPLSDKKLRKIRIVTYTIGAIVSVVIIALILIYK